MRPRISEILVADAPRQWEAIGFAVQHGVAWVDGVALRLGAQGAGITGWRLGPWPDADPHEGPAHPNGVTGIDHLVLVTEDWDPTLEELGRKGIELSRERRSAEVRQGFVRLGRVILELVERPGHDVPPGFWGLTFVVRDLDALADHLGDRLGAPRAAVQPGRWIAPLRAEAGASPAVAFITADAPNAP